MTQRLPGDTSSATEIARIIRVDHAGEYGAARIYAGQLAVLGRRQTAPVLREMQQQEREHLDRFAELIFERRVRPTVLLPVWHIAGFALGAATAALGERAAIDAHYASQIDTLDESEAALRDTLTSFRQDELHHRDIGLQQGAEQAPGYRLMSAAIKAGCRLAIRISERV
jgi:ubiquinone biosynthesis monooxygenase Coq7